MPKYVSGTYLLVVDLRNNLIKELIEWPKPKKLTKKWQEIAKLEIIKKHEEYQKKYSTNSYDLILVVANGKDDLKTSFPELSGWETATKQQIIIQ